MGKGEEGGERSNITTIIIGLAQARQDSSVHGHRKDMKAIFVSSISI